MAYFTHQDQPDLVYIKTGNCKLGKVEVEIVPPQQYSKESFYDSARNVDLSSCVLMADLQRNDALEVCGGGPEPVPW